MKNSTLEKIKRSNHIKTTDLDLSSSRIKKFPLELRPFNRLKTLNLFNNELSGLPEFFRDFINLNNLVLGNNNFIVFPEQISSCQNLKSLSLKSNRLTDLIGIQHLATNLEKIDLADNKLETLRIDFSKFEKLRHIDLSDNNIKKFPKSIVLETLKVLNLSSNQISEIPSSISGLKNLRELDLSFNNIDHLPEEIGELTELRTLNLTGNKISELPKSLSKLKNLIKLDVTGNQLDDIPLEIQNQGLKAILNYYMHLGISVKLNEAKLLIVGQGNVGKTFLINKLITGKTPETETTQGIDIVKWKFKNIDDSIRLNAWDFGGQEIYHSTHQFFLTKRSIYLFVWEARKDDSMINFDYWLNIIQTLSSASPVIVVMNKMDSRIKEIDEKSLKEKFPDIKGFFKVSATEGTNLIDLIEKIKDEVLLLPHIGDKLPEAWSKIRNELESLEENYISYDNYKQICNSFGFSTEQSKHVSQYYHDLGVFLHFSDNSVLKPVVFLKPQWVTNCVYKILDLKDVILNFGEFSPNLLEDQLKDYSSQQISYIIELMKKFELCLELSNTKYLIPELLKPSSPDVLIDISNGIGMVYKYDFMPAGILPRLIVRLKESIYESYYWKNGVYLKHNETIGLVESNQFTREINIRTSGEEQALLLGIIKRELDNINQSLNHPYHKIEVMCCCDKCEVDTIPHMFDYAYLMKVKKNNFEYVQCHKYLVEVQLAKLIGPYQIFSSEYEDEFRHNKNSLIFDLTEISTRLLERKYIKRTEDIITDDFTDALRFKGYGITDQTRSGKSNVSSGELDIMVRNTKSMPISIIEAFRIDSFGLGNRIIIEHLNKLLIDYDTNGLPCNFILVYFIGKDFSDAWRKYQDYIEKLPNHHLYNDKAELISFAVKRELSKRENIKVLTTQHSRGENPKEIYHFFINMNKE